MAATFTILDKVILGSSQSSVSFTGLSSYSSYNDLKIIASTRTDQGGNYQNVRLTFNGSSSSYSDQAIRGYGGSTIDATTGGSSYIDLFYQNASGATSNTFGSYEIYIPNFRSANNKAVSINSVTETDAADAFAGFDAGIWGNTDAISSITLTSASGNLVANSSVYLYGIKKS